MTGKDHELAACQQRVLSTIESALQRREPRLASMFAMFTRLNANEGAPRTERLNPAAWWAWHRGKLRNVAGSHGVFDGRSHGLSAQLWLSQHARAASGLFAGAAVARAVLAGRLGHHR
jgi:hypothetical protein